MLEGIMSRPTVTSERIDDIPLLIYWLRRMHIDTIIDAILGPPHGNWQGLSYGQLALVFIAYILTECNHFLSPVQDWVRDHRLCLSRALGCPVRDTDFTDDRLGILLDHLGESEEIGAQIEAQMGQHIIRAYELPTDTARIDATRVSVYHQPKEGETLIRFGWNKDKRPGQRQFVEMLGTLDPAGVPLCSQAVGGQCADDPLYLPAWRRMVEVLGWTDFLVVGDCKLASIGNRARIQAGGGWYLAPLPMTGHTPDDLRRWVLGPPVPPAAIRLPKQEEGEADLGQGFELLQTRTWTDPQAKREIKWDERVLVLQSAKLVVSKRKGLAKRLARAEAALQKLKVKADDDLDSLTEKTRAILKQHKVSSYLEVTWTAQVTEHKRYLKRGRHGLNSPFEMVETTTWVRTIIRQEAAIEEFNTLAGWRLYVTNAPARRLDTTGIITCYRQQWQPERGFHRLKNAAMAVLPLLLRSDERIRGLLLLLVIALRAFTLFEFVARRSLAQQSELLRGLYAGNPKRATTRPTAERLLKAFDNLTLYRLADGDDIWYQVSPLSDLQKRILDLVDVPESTYADLTNPLLDDT
jgi:transposase